MNTISSELKLPKARQWLFDFTQDFEERIKWDKQTKKIAFLTHEKELKKGALVYTESTEGIGMETEYLEFINPEKISIKMISSSNYFKSFYGKWEYTDSGENTTTLRITYQYDLRFPYTLINFLFSKKIKKNMNLKLNDLENYLN